MQEQESRLDRLWRAVEASGAETDWLRFYEGFATARLIAPLEGQAGDQDAKLKSLQLDSGEVALVFDSEARFTAFIDSATDFIAMTGADLARALAPMGVSMALNPGVSPCETMLDPDALTWIANQSAPEVSVEDAAAGTVIKPPAEPDAQLLEGLGARIAELSAAVAEAWLTGTVAPDGSNGFLCVILPSREAAILADEIATELTRIGQIRATRPFGVAVVSEGVQLLAAARRFGIGLGAGTSPSDP